MTKKSWLSLLFLSAAALAQEPSASPQVRSVRISFVPPPLEGKISLGIYDDNDQLVRVLHQEAELDEFAAGADALVTKWDGKDDFGYDLWPATYHARGFLVAPMKIEELPAGSTAPDSKEQSVTIKLMPNPLEKNERPTVQLTAGWDDEDLLLKTIDGLPLLTIVQVPEIKSVSIRGEPEKKMLTVTVEAGETTRRFSISGLSRMMAFDCGEFELK